MEKTYIGLSCSAHDPAIAIMNQSGELVYAEATERSLQYKRALNTIADYYPLISSIVDKYTNPDSDLVISKNWSKMHQRNVKLAESGLSILRPILKKLPLIQVLLDRYTFMLKLQAHSFAFAGQNLVKEWKDRDDPYYQFVLKYNRSWSSKEDSEAVTRKKKKIERRYFNHHLCHAAAAAYASPFDEAVVAVIDGYGEISSTAFYHFNNLQLSPIKEIKKSKNSLGFYYSSLCAACGFNPELGDEWKVMGLAPYGKTIPALYEKLSALIPVKNGVFTKPEALFDKALFDKLVWNNNRHYSRENIACTGQQVFEDKMIECLGHLSKFSKSKNLVLVGGCALNSACNGKIKERTGYNNVYVYNAPGDDGTSVGAAILSFLQDHPASAINRQSLFSPYKGSFIDNKQLQKAIDNNPYHYDLGENRYKIAAKLISQGNVIGWVQDRAEFGPRALGNRSILADPRKAEIKDIINKTLKYREGFRPFAPSVMEEYGDEIFEDYQPSWYMDKTLKIKESWQQKIPGVTHVNGTGRLQTVNRNINPGFYELISEFNKLTGVPVVLNTSFNLAGKPIVHSVNDILASLYTSGLHAVIIDGHLFTKQPMDVSA